MELFDIILPKISVWFLLLRKSSFECFHIIKIPQEDPSICFSLKEKEVTLILHHIYHGKWFRQKIWIKLEAFLMILHQHYITFFNLLNFAKFALINLNFLSFFQVAISLSCIFNCIVRSSNSRNGFFQTIRKHH